MRTDERGVTVQKQVVLVPTAQPAPPSTGSGWRGCAALYLPFVNSYDQRGIALVSVMVAIVILVTALTMVALAFFGASRLTRRCADFTTASNFAEGVMEQVTAEHYARITPRTITAVPPRLPGAQCVVQVKPVGQGMKEVTVICSWLDGERLCKARFSTLVAEGALR